MKRFKEFVPSIKILQSNPTDHERNEKNSMLSMFSNQKSTENKIKLHQNELKDILQILEDVRLQSPRYHSGYVVAFSSALLSPILHNGIKFTWYRQTWKNNQFFTVDETLKSWYAPTVDDIGCKICVQVEDNYQNGFSRFVECDPLQADPLIVSLSESSLKNNYHESVGISVSLGVEEVSSSSNSTDDNVLPISYENSRPALNLVNNLSSALVNKENVPFLQFNGLSSVIIDSKGLFISIPVKSTDLSGQTLKSSLRVSSRGLRIPASEHIKVSCFQPSSLILEIPTRAMSRPKTDSSKEYSDSQDKVMESFLTSSTISIPWVYEGSYSPEAVASVSLNLSDDEKEKLKQEAEEDAINYASMVSCSIL